jgi:SAM-dependent methyltransferase
MGTDTDGATHDDGHVTRTYDALAADYARLFPGTEPEAALDLAMIDHLLTLAGPTPRVLDAGCGTGRMARHLTDRGARVTGLDLSPGMLAMARRDHPDIGTVVGSITHLPYADGSFDAALYWYSTIHSPDADLPRIAGEAAGVVRPDAPVLVAFQVGTEPRLVGRSHRAAGHDVRLLRFHRSLDAWSGVLAAAGLVEAARLERAALGEQDPQGFLLARRPG